jgi:hypothetical protein
MTASVMPIGERTAFQIARPVMSTIPGFGLRVASTALRGTAGVPLLSMSIKAR